MNLCFESIGANSKRMIRKLALQIPNSRYFVERRELKRWRKDFFAMPAPHFIKMGVLKRWGGKGIWIETGTYLGDTAAELSKIADSVFTVEPADKFYLLSHKRLGHLINVEVANGTSEDCLPIILQRITKDGLVDDVSFWLDGHFSQGQTFQGKTDTPILDELKIISEYIDQVNNFTILIDDVRLFRTDKDLPEDYPSIDQLVNFANQLRCYWTIESDIFIITNRN